MVCWIRHQVQNICAVVAIESWSRSKRRAIINWVSRKLYAIENCRLGDEAESTIYFYWNESRFFIVFSMLFIHALIIKFFLGTQEDIALEDFIQGNILFHKLWNYKLTFFKKDTFWIEICLNLNFPSLTIWKLYVDSMKEL